MNRKKLQNHKLINDIDKSRMSKFIYCKLRSQIGCIIKYLFWSLWKG